MSILANIAAIMIALALLSVVALLVLFILVIIDWIGGDNMNYEQDCNLRLPCGICRLTMTDCPKLNQLAYITTFTGATASCEANMCAEKGEKGEVTE